MSGKREHSQLDAGRRLAEQVDAQLERGNRAQARRLVSLRWQGAASELPLRFPVVLEQVKVGEIRRLAERLRAGERPPALELHRRAGAVQIRIAGGKKLGCLPQADTAFIAGLGEAAALYTPHLLELVTRAGAESVAVELVRPELRSCSFCGNLHTGAHINCSECRAKRRRLDPKLVVAEPAPVLLAETLEAVAPAEAVEGEGG